MLHFLLLLLLPSTFCHMASDPQQDEQCIKKITSNLSGTSRILLENAMLCAQLVPKITTNSCFRILPQLTTLENPDGLSPKELGNIYAALELKLCKLNKNDPWVCKVTRSKASGYMNCYYDKSDL
ncbi:MAG: hypothetical protein MHMPM18_004273 [Marteilia pararefringens]